MRRAGGRPKAASGLVSVIPQPWMMVAPKRFSNASMSDSGTAAPPAVIERTLEKSTGVSRWSNPFQMVGTPHEGRVVLVEDTAQLLAHQEHLGHDDVASGQPCSIGGAPGIGVEHRDDDRGCGRAR